MRHHPADDSAFPFSPGGYETALYTALRQQGRKILPQGEAVT